MFHRRPSILVDTDPEIASIIERENQRQEEHIELIASENYASHGGDGGAGQPAHQQVRRGLSGQALLRRLRVRRHGRAAGDRPGEAAVRRRLRQRPAQLRLAGQPGGVLRLAAAGRHGHGHEPCRGRPPHPRHAAQHERQVVQGRELRPDGQGRDRLRPDGAAGARAPAQADHRRRLGLQPAGSTSPASPRWPRTSAPSSWSTSPTTPAWWSPATTRIRCRMPTSSPRPRTRACAGRAAASS